MRSAGSCRRWCGSSRCWSSRCRRSPSTWTARTAASAAPEIRQRLALTEQRLLALKRDVASRGAVGLDRARERRRSRAASFSGAVDSVTYVAFEDRVPRIAGRRSGARVEDYVPLLADGVGRRGHRLRPRRAAGAAARTRRDGARRGRQRRRWWSCAGRAGSTPNKAMRCRFSSVSRTAASAGSIAIQVVEHFAPAYLAAVSRGGVSQDAARRAARARDDQPGLLDGVLRHLHPRSDAPAAAAPRHAASTWSRPAGSPASTCSSANRCPEDDARSRRPRESSPMARVPSPSSPSPLNAHADKLNRRLFSSMDYVVIARR